jgi:hypothetical protein
MYLCALFTIEWLNTQNRGEQEEEREGQRVRALTKLLLHPAGSGLTVVL